MSDEYTPGYVSYRDRARGLKVYQPTINGMIIWGRYFRTATEAKEFAEEAKRIKEEEELENESN